MDRDKLLAMLGACQRKLDTALQMHPTNRTELIREACFGLGLIQQLLREEVKA